MFSTSNKKEIDVKKKDYLKSTKPASKCASCGSGSCKGCGKKGNSNPKSNWKDEGIGLGGARK